MKLEDYPPQEPLSAAGQAYGDECLALGRGIDGEEIAFGADPYQRLTVFRAPRPDGRVLIFWHGGGWTSGYKEWMAFMAPAFTAQGVTFVTAGYRLAPAHLFPVGLEDCAAAVQVVHRRCREWGGDPVAIHVGGHSAGGHYAALLGVSDHWRKRLGVSGDMIAGVLPLSGVYAFGEGSGLPSRPRFLGDDPRNELEASPLHFVGTAPAGTAFAPFLVAWGTHDFPHLAKQGERFAETLASAGGSVGCVVMAERTHFTASLAGGEAAGPWVPEALAFMKAGTGQH